MIKKTIAAVMCECITALMWAQYTVSGTFAHIANQQVKLTGFSGFHTRTIDSAIADARGAFSLSYSEGDCGMGVLVNKDNHSFAVILSGENVQLKGESLTLPESIQVVEGQENKWFAQYASEHSRREQCRTAWEYLAEQYEQDTLFASQRIPRQVITAESKRLRAEDSLFLAGLPDSTYVHWYLPLRKLLNAIPTVAQYRAEELPRTLAALRKIDYTDPRVHGSGLLTTAVESHFWLIENSGRPLDAVYAEMKVSIDYMVANLIADQQYLNEVTAHLFRFLEKRSLFTASEYLALRLLNEKSCTLNNDFRSQLEGYRAMKKGNTAPEIEFTGDVFAPAYKDRSTVPRRLSDIACKFKAVVFGAAWCPQCPSELQHIANSYEKWKQQGVEVLFVSLDEDPSLFKRFIQPFPFISACDYQKWDSPVVADWHVFATPTIYLLDDKRNIVLKPHSFNHLNAWIEHHLVQGRE